MSVRYTLPFVVLWGTCMGQFPNMFGGGAMSPGGGTNPGSNCTTATISCYPWCSKQLGADGCLVCKCSSSGSPMSGGSPMGGVNPMYGMNPMGPSGANPMNSLFSGLSGGISPMTGTNLQLQAPAPGCGPVPTTCPVPQPWCERIAGKDGCVRCMCGKELMTYIEALKTQTVASSTSPPSSASTSSPSKPHSSPTTFVPTTTSDPSSCIYNFYCSKTCSQGYKVDKAGCPLCECIQDALIDTPVDATDPPGKHSSAMSTTHAPALTNQVVSCPGIFDCMLVCNNGYKTSSNGCPLCECSQ